MDREMAKKNNSFKRKPDFLGLEALNDLAK
jgi:hypothetical protein